MTSIFNQPKQSTSNLFGTSNTTSESASQPPSTTNIFGNLNSSQPAQQSSIFDGNSKPSSSTSLFSDLGKTKPQQSNAVASGTSGLLGSTLAGGSQSTSQPFGLNAGLQNSTNSQATNVTNQSGYFNSLLERGKKRARGTDEGRQGFGQIPSIQLGLGDIAQRVKALGNIGVQGEESRSNDSKA